MDNLKDEERCGVQQESGVFAVGAYLQDANARQVVVPVAETEAVGES
jgi:hypothetical protein